MKQVSSLQSFIGWVGALSIVMAYFTLTMDWLSSDDIAYNMLNLAGGALLGYRVYLDRNWANLFLELFFISVALFALAQILL